jgi:hypothetical protein
VPRKKAITAVPIKASDAVAEAGEVLVPEVIHDEDPVSSVRSILSADGLYGIADAIEYLESYVRRRPDIDGVVDRGTERSALLFWQSWSAVEPDRRDAALLDIHWKRWGVFERKTAWLRRWFAVVDSEPAREPKTYEEAWAKAREEGWVPPAEDVEKARQALEHPI